MNLKMGKLDDVKASERACTKLLADVLGDDAPDKLTHVTDGQPMSLLQDEAIEERHKTALRIQVGPALYYIAQIARLGPTL
jgi:hypothetical protein